MTQFKKLLWKTKTGQFLKFFDERDSNFEENLFSKIASYNEETQYIEAKFENVIFNGKIVDKFNDI